MDEFRKSVRTYTARYSLVGAEVDNKPYDLIESWTVNSSWPNAEYQGVYAIFCADKRLLYVGKASLGGTIGRRLSTYFIDNPDGPGAATKPGHSWSRVPRYVLTTKVDKAWEAPSLEEYLIEHLRPIDNSQK